MPKEYTTINGKERRYKWNDLPPNKFKRTLLWVAKKHLMGLYKPLMNKYTY